MPPRTPFNKLLCIKRREKSLTMKQLAKMLMCTESTVQKWENNDMKRGITLYYAARISKILGWPLEEMAEMVVAGPRFIPLPPKE